MAKENLKTWKMDYNSAFDETTVQLLTVLIRDNVTTRASCICSKDNSVLPDHSANGGSSLGHLGRLETLLRKHGVPLAVLEVEARGRRLHWHQGRHLCNS